MRWSVAVVALTGCSQLFGLTSPQLGDAHGAGDASDGMTDGPRNDVPITPGSCVAQWVAGPSLSDPAELGVNTTADEQAPFVTADGLDLYYSKDGEVYLSTRTALSGAFANGNKVSGLSSGSFEGKTFVSANKLRAFFSSTRAGGGGGAYDLFRGSRNATSGTFAVDTTYVGTLNTSGNEIDPHLTDDLLHIYYSTIASASPVIALATRATVNDSFGTPTVLTELSSGTGETGPTLTADELVIAFSSSRIATPGGTNLWYATRTSKTQPFNAPQLVPSINSGFFDDTPHLTADGCTLYFSSSKDGSYNLYTSQIQ